MNDSARIEKLVEERRRTKEFGKLLPCAPGRAPEFWPTWLYVVKYVGVLSIVLSTWFGTTASTAGLCVATGVLFLLERRLRPVAERVRERLIADGVVARGALVQVNEGYWKEGNDQSWPGAALVTFDRSLREDPERFEELADRVFELKEAGDRWRLPPALARLSWTLHHEVAGVWRVPVPADFAAARDTWLVHVMVPPRIDDRLFWLLALPDAERADGVAVLPPEMLTRRA